MPSLVFEMPVLVSWSMWARGRELVVQRGG